VSRDTCDVTKSSSSDEPQREVADTPQETSADTEYLWIPANQPKYIRRPIIITSEHAQLMEELSAIDDRNWGEEALLGCLRRLESGGATEAAEVKVHDGWALDEEFCLVYASPWGPTVGVRIHHDGDQFEAAYTYDPSPNEFGIDIADFTVAEPLGTYADHLILDSYGLGWWGDHPLPPERPRRE
jgi:hypothetical protein